MGKKKREITERTAIKRQSINLLRYQELARLLREPTFGDAIRNTLQTPIEVIVLATMSAGKSTLLNAMIGRELLPAGNEACTARICRIEDCDWAEEFCARLNTSEESSEWLPATPEFLRKLNELDKPGIVELTGNIEPINNLGAHLILYDTPGPNNSRDKQHEAVTSQILKDGHYGLVLYLLNATQLGVTDDSCLLRQLQEVSNDQEMHKEVVFVLNKADQFDEERGAESLSEAVADVETYLKAHGFENPVIIPTCAHGAMIARQLKSGISLTRRERGELSCMIAQFKENPHRLTKVARMSKQIKAKMCTFLMHKIDPILENVLSEGETIYTYGAETIGAIELEQFIASTGVKALELILEDLLLRQGLPATMQLLHNTFTVHDSPQMAKWIKV